MVACHISKVVSTCFLQEKNTLWILWEGFCSIQYLCASACCCLALLLLFAGSALCELGPSMPCPCGQHQPMVYTFLSDLPLCIWLCHLVPWKQVRNFCEKRIRVIPTGKNPSTGDHRHLDIEHLKGRFFAELGKH